MGQGHHCCSKKKMKKGLWSPEEDEKLITYITKHGLKTWSSLPKLAGLQRCGKSCRLRWINYLRPDLKRGSFTAEEEQIIIDVHRILGNRWAQIAKHLPGRTDNEVKNFWNSCIKKKLISHGLNPQTHTLLSSSSHTITNNPNNISLSSHSSYIQLQNPINNPPNNNSIINFIPIEIPNPNPKPQPNNNILQVQTASTNDIILSNNYNNPHSHSQYHESSYFMHESSIIGNTPGINISSGVGGSLSQNEKDGRIWVCKEKETHIAGPDHQDKGINIVEVRQANNNEGNNNILPDELNINPSFEGSNFDFALLETLLNPDEFMSHDLSLMDEVTW